MVEMDAYLDTLGRLLGQARYEFSCFGDYPSLEYGSGTDGVLPQAGNARRKREIGAGSLVEWKGPIEEWCKGMREANTPIGSVSYVSGY